MAGRGDARAVIAARDEEGVAGLHDHGLVDLAVCGVRAVDAVPVLALDLEVVDLLELGLGLARLVVLVRRVAGPVSLGREHLDADEPVGGELAGAEEVVQLARAGAGAADLDRDLLGGGARGGPAVPGGGAGGRATGPR